MRPVHIKEQRQKEVRRIDKEHREIRKKIHGLPLVKLDKPIRHGWYKEIVLTENLDRYKTQEVVYLSPIAMRIFPNHYYHHSFVLMPNLSAPLKLPSACNNVRESYSRGDYVFL